MATPISLLFDRVLLLEEGETIVVKFTTSNELKSKKTMLFREKTAYEAKMNKSAVTKGIVIRQAIDEFAKTYKLLLSSSGTSLDWLNDAVIKSVNGENKLELLPKDERLENMKTKM